LCWRSARATRAGPVRPRTMSTRGRYALSIFFALTLAWLWGAPVRPAHAQAPARPPTPGEIVVKELAVQGNRRVQEAGHPRAGLGQGRRSLRSCPSR
jgi:hypothetical protein